jgi:hypothetical protein
VKLKAYKVKQNNIEHISDITPYLDLPKKDRLLWGIFYVHPKYVTIESLDDFFIDGKFESQFDKYFKRKYPIQFFFRKTFPNFIEAFFHPPYLLYCKIKNFCFPSQRWLYKKIPNNWVPSTDVFMISIFESIVHYVEKEKWFKHIDWDFDEDHKEINQKIIKIYRWAKIRVKLNKKINEDYSNLWEIYRKILDSGDKHFATMAIDISDKLY